jgi:hypothetical protein
VRKVESDNEDGAQHPQGEHDSSEHDSHSSSIHAAIIAARRDTGNSNLKPIRAKPMNLTLASWAVCREPEVTIRE